MSLQRAQALAAHQYGPESNVDSATNQLGQAQAMIQKTQAIIAQKDIRAPFSGKLGVRQVDLGQYLNPGAPVVTLTDLSVLYVNFHAAVADYRADQSRAESRRHGGRLSRPQIHRDDHHDRAANLRQHAHDQCAGDDAQPPDNALLPGMFVNAAVVLPDEPPVVVLPETAVDYTLYGDSVYVLRPDGAAGADGQAGADRPSHAGHHRGLRWGRQGRGCCRG